MKFVILSALIAVVASSAVPNDEVAPAFNPRQDTRFLLFTRFNPTIPQILSIDNMASISNSNYSPARPLRVLIHGWNNNANSDVNTLITASFMRSYDVNVIVVDWAVGANTINYINSRNQVNNVGTLLGELLDNMQAAGHLADFSRVNIIGHSLGAHIAGIAGKRVQSGRINTIVGLDPAGPLFSVNNPNDRIDSTDAEYVEIIHTDTRSFGFGDPIGHTDFYPNGGFGQPGCLTQICDHGRVVNFFVESLNYQLLWGRRCNNMQEMESNTCQGAGASMGGEPSNFRLGLRGIYRFATNANPPLGQGPF